VGGYLILVDNSLNITREWHTSVLSVLPHFFYDYILDDGQIHSFTMHGVGDILCMFTSTLVYSMI
jgi:hypothetical protein